MLRDAANLDLDLTGVGGENRVSEEIQCSMAEGVATIILNRPDRRNALNTRLLTMLREFVDELETKPDIRVVVIRGEGRAFCSGMDLQEMFERQGGGGPAPDPRSDLGEIVRRIEASRLVSIAMVHGDAFAGGCELALHCDLRIAGESARFAMTLARLGLVVPFAFGQKLVEVIGPAATREVLLTAQPVDAQRAYHMGLVSQVVPTVDLETRTYELARTIAANAPLALAGMKAIILRTLSGRERIDHTAVDALAERARNSNDAREGVRAFLEKRPAKFRGE